MHSRAYRVSSEICDSIYDTTNSTTHSLKNYEKSNMIFNYQKTLINHFMDILRYQISGARYPLVSLYSVTKQETHCTPQSQNSVSKRTVHSAYTTIHTPILTLPQYVIKRLRLFMSAPRRKRGIVTLILNLTTRCGRVVSFMLRSQYARERTPNPRTQ